MRWLADIFAVIAMVGFFVLLAIMAFWPLILVALAVAVLVWKV